MLQIEMSASLREVTGKGPMRQLRMKGLTPAVVYGAGQEAVKLQLETKTLMSQLLKFYRRNTLVSLKIDDQLEKNVVIGEVQTDPVKDTLVHVDFCEIDMDTVRTFNVPLTLQGVAKGVDMGGVLNVGFDTIEIAGKPLDIPDEVFLDVTALEIGDSIKCSHIEIKGDVTLITDSTSIAVSVAKPGVKVEDLDEDEATEDATAEGVEAEQPAAE